MFSVRSWFRRHHTPLLGVDVSPAGIRIMELVREGEKFPGDTLRPGACAIGCLARRQLFADGASHRITAPSAQAQWNAPENGGHGVAVWRGYQKNADAAGQHV